MLPMNLKITLKNSNISLYKRLKKNIKNIKNLLLKVHQKVDIQNQESMIIEIPIHLIKLQMLNLIQKIE